MNTYLALFLILAIGYAFGRLEIKGLGFGTAGILLVALVFGHFGVTIPAAMKNLGLAMFVGSVGLIAGPVFFENFKKKAVGFIMLGLLCILLGSLVCILCIKFMDIPKALSIGLLTGALTSTPGLAAALEATGDTMASVGYGIAYVYGVVGVVLFVQIVPMLYKERPAIVLAEKKESETEKVKAAKLIELGTPGFFALSFTCALGVLLGTFKLPLPGGVSISLGTSGGPLFMGLIIGSMGHIGPFNLKAPKHVLEVVRELGLILFLAGAGTEAGAGFLEILAEQGMKLVFAGFLMTTVPMVIMYIFAVKFFKLDVMTALGSVCGGMTSTPALGALIGVAKSDAVTVSYAATYPIALIMVVLMTQVINIIC